MLRDGVSVSLGFLPGTLALCLFGLLLVENRAAPGAPEPSARYIGQEACAGCHQAESAQWKTSHHALAMQKASDGTVLGRLQRRGVRAFRRHDHILPRGRQVHGAHRRSGRDVARL